MHPSVKLGNLIIGDGHPPVFIAEIGINHGGDYGMAVQMVDEAVAAGADIVKFQHHIPEAEMVASHPWFQLMIDCQLIQSQLRDIKAYVESKGREFLCTPFSFEAAAQLMDIGVNGFKVGSGELNHIEFQKYIASFGLPMLVSTGMSSRDEIKATTTAIRKQNRHVVLLNCTSTYPATAEQSRLRRIEWLRSTFNLPVGQSDHTPTISTALGAIALGAVCIEKHFTLDRGLPGPDHSGSVLPREFRQLVDMGMEIWQGTRMCVEASMGVLPEELAVRKVANHSEVAPGSWRRAG